MTNRLFSSPLVHACPSETHLSDKILVLRADATLFGVCERGPRRWLAQPSLSLAVSHFPLFRVRSSASSQQEEWSVFTANEAHFLYQMFEDIQAFETDLRTSPAAISCRTFVTESGRLLALQPHTRCAVFPDENDSVTLIAHSGTLKRQVSFEFHSDGNTLDIIKIDEHMQHSTRSSTVRDLGALRNAIAWLASC